MHIFNQLSPTKAKIVKNLAWAVSGKVVTLLGGLLIGIFVARYLGPEQYGLMNYILSYVAIFQVIASFGLDSIEIREEARNSEQRLTIIGTAFLLKLIFAIGTIGIILVTTFLFQADMFTRWMILLYSLSIVLNSFNVIRNYFTSIVWNEYIVKTEISRTLIGIAFKIALLLLHAPFIWFIIALLLDVVLLASGYILSFQHKVCPIHLWKFDSNTARMLLRESFPLLFSGAAVIIYQRIDQVMIGDMVDHAALGQYAIAATLVEVSIYVPTVLAQTISPVLVQTYKDNPMLYQEKAQTFLNITTWICILVSCLMCLLAYPLIRYTFGLQYMAAIPILQLLTFKLIGISQAQVSGQLIIIENIQQWAVIRNIIGCVCCVVLNLILLQSLGAMGAAISAIITAIVSGYLAHLCIPAYHHIFHMQTQAFITGWRDLFKLKQLLS